MYGISHPYLNDGAYHRDILRIYKEDKCPIYLFLLCLFVWISQKGQSAVINVLDQQVDGILSFYSQTINKN